MILGTAESYSYSYPHSKQSTLNVVSGDSINSIFSKFSLNIAEKMLLKIFLLNNNIYLIQAGHYDISSMSWREILINLYQGNIKRFEFQIKVVESKLFGMFLNPHQPIKPNPGGY